MSELPTLPPEAPHVQIDLATGDVTCDACGDRLPLGLPMPIDCVLALLTRYAIDHARCTLEHSESE